jgi:UDP-glucose 4-epimerase
MPEPGTRDWTYAPDAAEAVAILVEAERPRHRLYNISNGVAWPALQWGEAFAALHPGLECRLAAPEEKTAIKLHGPYRAPLSVTRMADEFGWRARFGCAESAAAMSAWLKQHKEWI